MAASGAPATATTRNAPIILSLDHPLLLTTDPDSIRYFLRKYDQYANEVRSRARQLSTICTEAARPVALTYCVYVDFLESSIALEFIKEATNYDDVSD